MVFTSRDYKFESDLSTVDHGAITYPGRASIPQTGSRSPTVHIMPRHPFDYPFFETIQQIIGEDTDAVDRMLSRLGWEKIEFVFPSMVPLASALAMRKDPRVRIRKTKPVYPGLPEIQRAQVETGLDKHLDWFEFLSLLAASFGIGALRIPVVFTDLSTGAGAAFFVDPGTPISVILDLYHPDTQEYTVFDHPFMGKSVSPGQTVSENKPHTLIAAVRDNRKKPGPATVLGRMAFERVNYSFSGLYNAKPRELDTPCQKCLHCVRICPAKIWPFMISALARNEDVKGASVYKPDLCIECGLCTYVCPSGIPLMHNIQSLKRELGFTK